jgi:predicted phage terminase large subunit-like protein
MGSYLFANQYQNEVIPDDERRFKLEWLKYYKGIPDKTHVFCFIDPALSNADGADFTGLVVIHVDILQNWYVTHARRFKINPTQIVQLVFDLEKTFKPKMIGIEEVAYQKALLYMLDEEMRRRNVILPIKGVRPTTDKTKEMRILGLVPRFEWGRILLAQGLHDFESEYSQFPRAAHDDLLDSLAYMDQIVYYPTKERKDPNAEPHPSDPGYESWYIRNLTKQGQSKSSYGEGD